MADKAVERLQSRVGYCVQAKPTLDCSNMCVPEDLGVIWGRPRESRSTIYAVGQSESPNG